MNGLTFQIDGWGEKKIHTDVVDVNHLIFHKNIENSSFTFSITV
jgi:hypothetical protein